MPYEPDDEVKDAVSTIVARVAAAYAQNEPEEYESVFVDIEELYRSDPKAILDLLKGTVVLAAIVSLKDFQRKGL
jgi:hypothetical protein